MRKTILISMSAILVATTANAGWFDFLKSAKEPEPTTLAEACNKDEVSQFCPEILLGEKTIPTCLADNVKALSKKCAKFVKKSIKEQVANVSGEVATVKDGANNTVTEQVNVVAEQKAAAKATAKEIKDTAKQVKQDAKETGAALKNMFKADAE